MKIYTRTGDEGDTSLFSGGRVRKNDPRVNAYGTVDELNSLLGLARAHGVQEPADSWLEAVQNELFTVGADLATPMDSNPEWLVRMTDTPIARLEAEIDRMDEELPELKNFILPAGVAAAATIHVARTVCRRAERECVDAIDGGTALNEVVMVYLNRLSDWLFTLARWVNLKAGENETRWGLRGK
ncbi:MAG: cob(I)yrinic acid a,c-diamide adenosyltransferase [Chloroflexi bacterium]|nr:cob(I)yrinic acid a,c-diamide adenosyltransferase [Chloroflexota bacterium]